MSDWGRGRQDGGGGGRGGGGGGGFGGSRGGPSMEMEVPCRDVSKIIGRGGSKIRELQEDSGCRINVRKDTDNGSTTVVELQGDHDAQQMAKGMIEDYLAQANSYGGGGGGGGYSDRGRSGGGGYDRRGDGGGGHDDGDALEMEVQSKDVGRIIGRGGSMIRELQDDSGARIKIRKDKDNGVTTVIELQGSSEAQQKAKKLIDDHLNGDGRDNKW